VRLATRKSVPMYLIRNLVESPLDKKASPGEGPHAREIAPGLGARARSS
jgi:hypothetical protein